MCFKEEFSTLTLKNNAFLGLANCLLAIDPATPLWALNSWPQSSEAKKPITLAYQNGTLAHRVSAFWKARAQSQIVQAWPKLDAILEFQAVGFPRDLLTTPGLLSALWWWRCPFSLLWNTSTSWYRVHFLRTRSTLPLHTDSKHFRNFLTYWSQNNPRDPTVILSADLKKRSRLPFLWHIWGGLCNSECYQSPFLPSHDGALPAGRIFGAIFFHNSSFYCTEAAGCISYQKRQR